MKKFIKTAVIGVGYLGSNHARIYAQMEGVELAAVIDTDPAKAKEIGSRYNCPWFTSLDDMPSVDAASIAVTTTAHYEVALKLMEKDVHLLIEKPITQHLHEARELCDKADKKGLFLQAGHIERYNPAISEIQKHVTDPRFIEIHRLAPFKARGHDVGVVLDLMIHDIDILLSFVNSPIKKIDAVGVPVLTRTEDIANARISFENGCVANVTASRISQEEMRKFRIFYGDSYISLDYKDQEGFLYKKDGMAITRSALPVEKGEPLKIELESFIRCVKKGVQPKVTGRHASKALETALQISAIIRTNLPENRAS